MYVFFAEGTKESSIIDRSIIGQLLIKYGQLTRGPQFLQLPCIVLQKL
jgi:hypothetical protein